MDFLKKYQVKSRAFISLLILLVVIIGEITLLVGQRIDTAHWTTYRNTEFGFEITYPKGWIITEERSKETKAKRRFSISSNELSFNILISSNDARLGAFFNDLQKAPIKETFRSDKNSNLSNSKIGVIYSIQEHLNVSNSIAVIYYIDYSLSPTLQRAFVPRIDSAMMKRGETIFDFSLTVEQDALVEKNKDIFKQTLSTFRFIDR